MTLDSKGVALITGASSGIGAVYADRLARRGHDLILVARNRERLGGLSARLTDETGHSVEMIVADLNNQANLAQVEQRLRDDDRITVLVNNAGITASGGLVDANLDLLEKIIRVNAVAVMRLTGAVVPGFVARGRGTVINIGSVTALMPETFNGTYSGTKAFVLNFSQALQAEVGKRGIRVQVVLPGRTRTEIWERAGIDFRQLPPETIMEVHELVDAALAGLDRGELSHGAVASRAGGVGGFYRRATRAWTEPLAQLPGGALSYGRRRWPAGLMRLRAPHCDVLS